MYRPEVKILDVTIRDGGLMNNWDFSKNMVKDIFYGLAEAGVDYVELGYRADKRLFSPSEYGPWRFCNEEDLRDVACECDTKISVMCDVGKTNLDDFILRSKSIISMVRVACYISEVDEGLRIAQYMKDLGYEVSLNLMAVSTVDEHLIDEALKKISKSNVDLVYIVDSFGYYYSEHIRYLTEKYIHALPGKAIGIHTHNNRQLAFANSIEALLAGAQFVDSSLYGMGRAAGNCTTELLLSFLENPKYDLKPVLDLIERYFVPLKDELKWGYELPYLVTGVLNQHPRTALAYIKEQNQGTQHSLKEFYESHIKNIKTKQGQK
ncbi:MAG TPA: aldolase catalytic domain-containing protein [Candidatus Hydrogenedens sp.]|nr:aldolase catalytic domain-containing protein [Candidatus Hydrogenedens sp.]